MQIESEASCNLLDKYENGKSLVIGAENPSKRVGGFTAKFGSWKDLECFALDKWWSGHLNPNVKIPISLDVRQTYSDPKKRPLIYCATMTYKIEVLLSHLEEFFPDEIQFATGKRAIRDPEKTELIDYKGEERAIEGAQPNLSAENEKKKRKHTSGRLKKHSKKDIKRSKSSYLHEKKLRKELNSLGVAEKVIEKEIRALKSSFQTE